MSCDIDKGRLTSCKDTIAGLLAVYFINYESVTSWTMGTGEDAEVVQTVVPSGTDVQAFKYDLHLGNDLTQNIMASPENGTLYFEQLLNLTLKRLSKEDNPQVKQLAAGRPYILVEDQMGNVMLAGRINGMDVTGGTAVTGNDFGDLNGYTLTFTGKERTLANFTVADFLTTAPIVIVPGTVPTPA